MSTRNLTALTVLVCLFISNARTMSVASSYSPDAVRLPGPLEGDRCAPTIDRPNLPGHSTVPRTGHNNFSNLDWSAGRISIPTSHMRIPFIANEGQEHKDVRFYAQTYWGTVFVTHTGHIVYSLPATSDVSEDRSVALGERLLGRKRQRVEGVMPATAVISYFVGDDPADWRTGITTYHRVDLGEVYEGIQLQLEAHGNNVEKIFIVEPGAQPTDIRMQVDGVEHLTINATGELEAHTRSGLATFTRPVAYQEDTRGVRNIEVAYQVHGNEYGFSVGDYDRQIPLIIDPLLASTFLGGSGHDGAARGASVALDADGNVYVVATTRSLDFPTTSGAYNEEHSGAGQADVCISKLDSNLTTLLASTFLGGSSDELADRYLHIAVSGDGDVCVAGRTESPDFPTTLGAFDTAYDGGGDVFVSRLSSDLSTLLASTLIGGPERDTAGSVAVDGTGNVYVAGYTRSPAFPTTPSAYQPTHHGNGPLEYGGDIYIAKFTSDLSTLSASTFLGGNSLEDHGLVAPVPDGRIYVAGSTVSADFPTTPGAFNTTPPGTTAIFVSLLSSDLSVLHASTFVDGNGIDVGAGMTLDDGGNIYVTGLTTSTDFPTTPGAYSETYTGIGGHPIGDDVYVIKLDGELTTVLAGTYLGGTGWEHGWRVAVDSVGSVYVAGITTSLDFPTGGGSFQSRFGGGAVFYDSTRGGDGYVARLTNDLSTLSASTYLGTGGGDYLSALAVNGEGEVYVGGGTDASSFPTTAGAFDESYNGGSTTPFGGDLFISKLDGLLSGDCNGNGIPDICDVDCLAADGECNVPGCGGSEDSDENGRPDECCPLSAPPEPDLLPTTGNPVNQKVRYLSFNAGDPGLTQAVRVTFKNLPPPYDTWNDVEMWVQEPATYCEHAGRTRPPCPAVQPTSEFTGATLDCDPWFGDFHSAGVIHVFHEGIVPGGTYWIEVVEAGCDYAEYPAGSFSTTLAMTQSAWGDVVRNCATYPCSPPDGSVGIPTDVTAVLDKFKNLGPPEFSPAVSKTRADLDWETPNQRVDISDVTCCLDAFRGVQYPPPAFEPPGPPPCSTALSGQ